MHIPFYWQTLCGHFLKFQVGRDILEQAVYVLSPPVCSSWVQEKDQTFEPRLFAGARTPLKNREPYKFVTSHNARVQMADATMPAHPLTFWTRIAAPAQFLVRKMFPGTHIFLTLVFGCIFLPHHWKLPAYNRWLSVGVASLVDQKL